MARRTLWLVTGVVVGAGSSLYAERKVRRTLEQAADRLRPESIVAQAGTSARQAASATGWRVRSAVASGRLEMARREQELWASLASSSAVNPSSVVDIGHPEESPVGASPQEASPGMIEVPPVSGAGALTLATSRAASGDTSGRHRSRRRRTPR